MSSDEGRSTLGSLVPRFLGRFWKREPQEPQVDNTSPKNHMPGSYIPFANESTHHASSKSSNTLGVSRPNGHNAERPRIPSEAAFQDDVSLLPKLRSPYLRPDTTNTSLQSSTPGRVNHVLEALDPQLRHRVLNVQKRFQESSALEPASTKRRKLQWFPESGFMTSDALTLQIERARRQYDENDPLLRKSATPWKPVVHIPSVAPDVPRGWTPSSALKRAKEIERSRSSHSRPKRERVLSFDNSTLLHDEEEPQHKSEAAPKAARLSVTQDASANAHPSEKAAPRNRTIRPPTVRPLHMSSRPRARLKPSGDIPAWYAHMPITQTPSGIRFRSAAVFSARDADLPAVDDKENDEPKPLTSDSSTKSGDEPKASLFPTEAPKAKLDEAPKPSFSSEKRAETSQTSTTGPFSQAEAPKPSTSLFSFNARPSEAPKPSAPLFSQESAAKPQEAQEKPKSLFSFAPSSEAKPDETAKPSFGLSAGSAPSSDKGPRSEGPPKPSLFGDAASKAPLAGFKPSFENGKEHDNQPKGESDSASGAKEKPSLFAAKPEGSDKGPGNAAGFAPKDTSSGPSLFAPKDTGATASNKDGAGAAPSLFAPKKTETTPSLFAPKKTETTPSLFAPKETSAPPLFGSKEPDSKHTEKPSLFAPKETSASSETAARAPDAASSTNGAPSLFGSKASDADEDSSAKKAKPSPFSALAPETKGTSASESTTQPSPFAAAGKPAFSFGDKPAFSFGAKPASSEAPQGSASPFSFAAKPSGEGQPSPFAFGANKAEDAKPSPFAFGAKKPEDEKPAAAPAFGTALSKPATEPAAGASSSPFAFGANKSAANPPAGGAPASGTPFSFGSGAPSGFSFGSSAPAPAPTFGGTSAAPAFGAKPPAPSTPAPAFGSGSAAPAFGMNTPAPAFGMNTGAPAFGASTPGPAFGTSTPGPVFGGGAPLFGAAPGAPPAAASPAGAGPFGAPSAPAAPGGTPLAAPPGRVIKPMRRRR